MHFTEKQTTLDLYANYNYAIMELELAPIVNNMGNKEKQYLKNLLFPDYSRPDIALKSVIEKKTFLNSKQIAALAAYLGCKVDDLYSGDGWKMSRFARGNYVLFIKGDVTAFYDQDISTSQVFLPDGTYRTLLHARTEEILNIISKLDKYIK